MTFAGRTAVITGGAGVIGTATARRLVAGGARVALVDRDAQRLESVARDLGAANVHVGPSDYVPWLTDRKWAYIRMEGSSFGDVPLNIELKLEVWDSPNSAGIVIDAVRLAKLALNNGVSGALEGPSSYLMKSPPKQIVDDEAYEQSEEFIKRYHRKTATQPSKA